MIIVLENPKLNAVNVSCSKTQIKTTIKLLLALLHSQHFIFILTYEWAQ